MKNATPQRDGSETPVATASALVPEPVDAMAPPVGALGDPETTLSSRELDNCLFAAAQRKDSAECARLVERGANPNFRRPESLEAPAGHRWSETTSAFEWAVERDDLDCVRAMLPKGDLLGQSEGGETAWRTMLRNGSTAGMAMAEPFLSEVDAAQVDWEAAAETALTTLNVKSDGGPALLKAIAKRCDLNAMRLNGSPLLPLAAQTDDPQRVEALLPHCDANAKNMDGRTALMVAAKRTKPEIVKILLAFSDAKTTDPEGNTALILAAEPVAFNGKGRARIAECVRILAPVSDLAARNRQGETALGAAAKAGNEEAISILAQAGRGSAAFKACVREELDQALAKGQWETAEALSDELTPREAKEAMERLIRKKAPKIAALCEAEELEQEARAGRQQREKADLAGQEATSKAGNGAKPRAL